MNKKLIPNFLFIIVVLITAISIYKEGKNNIVLLSNFVIILLSLLFMVVGDKYNFSLNKIFMLFAFFFFGIAPAIQYQKGITLWGGSTFSDNDYIFQNFLIIAIILLYQVTYIFVTSPKSALIRNKIKINLNIEIVKNIRSRIKNRIVSSLNSKYFQHVNRIRSKVENRINRNFVSPKMILTDSLVLIALISLIITLFLYGFSFPDLIFRSGEIVQMKQSTYLIYSSFIRPLPIVVLVFYKQFAIENKKVELFLILSCLVTNFPTATPRFYAAAMYIPLLIIYYKKIQLSYLKLNRLMVYGLILIFPMLDQFRRVDSFTKARFSLDFNMFSTEHFDSYQMFMRVITENIITNGKQLITSALFFIPRSIWPEKSIGSGALIATSLEFEFTNVSMNYFGEGYINFGYTGIILFVIILAIINARLDELYWKINKKTNFLSIFYYFLIGIEFFILRGDLLSSFAFTSGIFVSVLFVQKFCSKHVLSKNNL